MGGGRGIEGLLLAGVTRDGEGGRRSNAPNLGFAARGLGTAVDDDRRGAGGFWRGVEGVDACPDIRSLDRPPAGSLIDRRGGRLGTNVGHLPQGGGDAP